MAIDQTIMKLLGEHRTTPSVLVLNKLDSIRDRYSMLPTIDNLTCGRLLSPLQPGENGIRYTKPDKEEVFQLNRGWPNFHEVLIVSARTGEGLDRLKDYLFSLAYPGPWLYNSDESVVLPPLKIIEELIREQIFAHFYQELPYIITQVCTVAIGIVG
jgi:GTPase Era involved in 16S rRNA processing